jgi:hypothetical protein
MPRFVILEHDHPRLHWDFLLEAGPVLRAWRLLAEPRPGAAVAAEPNYDHRPIYLDYEGPLSGGRGSVTRWDSGTFEWLTDDEAEKAVRLAGGRLRGVARWRQEAGGGWVWRLD